MKKTLSAFILVSALLFAPLAACFVPGASAETEPPASDERVSAAEERATAFRAVKGADTESVPGGALLIAAYLVLWALALGYLLRLGKLSRAIEADVRSLREAVDRADQDVR